MWRREVVSVWHLFGQELSLTFPLDLGECNTGPVSWGGSEYEATLPRVKFWFLLALALSSNRIFNIVSKMLTAIVLLSLGLWSELSGFPGSASDKEPTCSGDLRDAGCIPGSGRSPGRGHGRPLQCSCLENPMDRGAWRATVHRVVKESDMTEAT